MVKIYATKESLELHLGCRPRHSLDRRHLGSQRADAFGTDCVAKESDGGGAKNTFFSVDGQSRGVQTLQKLAHMPNVSGQVWACNQDVVQVDEDEVEAAEDAIHQPLKRLC